MSKKKLLLVSATALLATSLAACGGNNGNGDSQKGGDEPEEGTTAYYVAKASKMSLSELEEAAKAEMNASSEKFRIVGLTSTLSKAAAKFEEKYDWIKDKWTCNNSYKDYQLLTAIEAADSSYFADFALMQDVRSFSSYLEDGLLVNYVPSDYKDLGLAEKDTYPLKGIYFNKIFFSNKHMGINLTNVWQLSFAEGFGSTKGKVDATKEPNHISRLSFQSPVTEQINMSFLLSLYSDDGVARLTKAYKAYYGKDWAANETYANIADEYVTGLIANVTTWHGSDGTAMKETQAKETDPASAKIYYGAFAKMKDAAAKYYDVEYPDGSKLSATDADGNKYDSKTNSHPEASAMSTVKWDYNIEGFNGFMYCMDSQIVKNAQHPYTACLYARFLLTPDCYKAMCYNSVTANQAGEAANMYGYYYPAAIGSVVKDNDNDWTRDQWIQKSIVEDYSYLSKVKSGLVTKILTLVNSSKA